MQTNAYTVPSISCGHCVQTIERELKDVSGVTFVSADVASKKVTVEINQESDLPAFKALMDEIGYPVAN